MGSRPLRIPFASGGACLFTFRQLCSANLASADYLKLASRFHTLAIHDVPAISDASRDEVRRSLEGCNRTGSPAPRTWRFRACVPFLATLSSACSIDR
eukprot:3542170-Pleurochrysis_carterae.AAC.2